ncbi:MAG TPA: triose-phosphate isomerase [Egibacteraceae bacterium]|nr:triose-phosphate isomerase [Egibacteraceae bacterium]
MTRTPILAGNWKMNLDHLEAIQLVQQLTYHLNPEDYDASEIVVIPAFTALRSIQTLIEGDRLNIALGAQNCHWESAGAYTGEVSPLMLARLNVRYVLCGHSERRALFGEGDEVVNRKVHAVLAHDMTPILCVGETLEDREAGDAEKVVVSQLRSGLEGVSGEQAAQMVIAYEPVWAIGTGRTATAGDAEDMCGVVRGVVAELYGGDTAETVRVQYGGSVKPGNVAELMRQPQIDGALVGGASIDPQDFAIICRHHRL